uniref:Uncharacterized protein n=1 Tax=Physcomitrium patens TaxID=3218 RepID=A0A2K1IND6_PHYPA|nr:hypothetical protein PHYPA_027112 [Physcomitrium patens]
MGALKIRVLRRLTAYSPLIFRGCIGRISGCELQEVRAWLLRWSSLEKMVPVRRDRKIEGNAHYNSAKVCAVVRAI